MNLLLSDNTSSWPNSCFWSTWGTGLSVAHDQWMTGSALQCFYLLSDSFMTSWMLNLLWLVYLWVFLVVCCVAYWFRENLTSNMSGVHQFLMHIDLFIIALCSPWEWLQSLQRIICHWKLEQFTNKAILCAAVCLTSIHVGIYFCKSHLQCQLW